MDQQRDHQHWLDEPVLREVVAQLPGLPSVIRYYECAHRHRFESQQHASRVIGDWIQFYNHRRPHQALGMKPPAEAYALAA